MLLGIELLSYLKSHQIPWFPTPDGPFSITMRIYNPAQLVTDGQYAPPPIQLVEK
jgi:hypothetical protein